MADGQMEIEPGSLRQAGSDLHRAAEALDQAWQAFQPDAKNLRYGTTDTVGSLIGASYEGVLAWANTTYDSAAKAFASFGDAIHQMAERFDSAEQSTRSAVDHVGGDIGGGGGGGAGGSR
ncbi:MAG TPA: type VII secretion target [Streptosporangiaceae bacterium]|nr:type VII secretion target [Streptosporangiaceae bacterium]